jgi:hypothetical protein
MTGYKILYVEDQLDVMKSTCEDFFPELIKNVEFKNARTFDEIKSALKTIPYLNIANDFKDALTLLCSHAEDYLLFIVDRDLDGGKRPDNSIKDIKQLWGSISGDKYDDQNYRLGDLLLEYLCLERGFSKTTILNRFRFITAYDDLGNGTEIFLKTLHYDENERNALIVSKSANDEYNKLQQNVRSLLKFHIQNKHKDVFIALAENAENLDIDTSDHVINLIKALAYVEGAKLSGGHLEEPRPEMLRSLLEAFRRALKDQEDKSSNKYFDKPINWIKKLNKGYRLQNGDVSHWFNPSSYFGFHDNKIKTKDLCPACQNIHDNPSRYIQRSDPAYAFQQEHSHYSDINQMIFTITSQEVHFNERKRFEGKRLELVVYGLCELLIFYHNKFKGKCIAVNEKDRHRTRVRYAMEVLDKTEDGWIVISDLKRCANYIGKPDLDEINLDELGFEIDVCSRVKCESRN